MRFCPNCGAQLESDDAKFCQECGTNVQEFGNAKETSEKAGQYEKLKPEGTADEKNSEKWAGQKNSNASAASNIPKQPNHAQKPKTPQSGMGKTNGNKKSTPILMGGIAVVLVVLLVMLINHKPSINLNDYMDTGYYGYNTVATAYCNLDTEALKEAINKKVKISSSEQDGFDAAIDYLRDKLVPSQRFDLSNGDKVTITIEDKDAVLAMIEKYGIKIKEKDITLKVKNLPEVRHIELTDDLVDVFLSGYEEVPDISFSVKKTNLSDLIYADKDNDLDDFDIAELYDFLVENVTVSSLNDRASLTNGATAVFKIDTYAPEMFANDLGVIFESSQCEKEVSGLTPLKEVDLTDLITVDIEGVIPNLYLNSECDYSDYASDIITGWTPESGEYDGSNGDIISIDVSYDSELADEMGYKVINTHKEITVENLDTYEVDCSDLASSQWKALIDLREKGVADYYINNSDLLDIVNQEFSDNGYRILWNYFNVQPYKTEVNYYEKEGGSGNIVSLVFAVQTAVLRKDETIGNHTFYHVVNMRNLFLADGGTVTESGDYYDDGREGKYYSLEELDKLSGEIADYIRSDDAGADVQYSEAMYPDYEAKTVPETLAKTETEESAFLEAKEDAKTAPALDPEAEAMASAMIEYDGHKYYRFDIAWSWREAENFCQKYGYHLASVNTDKERKLIYALLTTENQTRPEYNYYWVGANYKDGAWIWTDGADFNNSLWQNGSADNVSRDYPVAYAYAGDYTYLYNTENMSENIGFIMEVYDKDAAEENADYLEACRVSEAKNVRYEAKDSYSEMHYSATLLNDDGCEYAEYDLNGKYSEFTGTLYTSDTSGSDISLNITFWGDGKLLYHQADMNRQSNGIGFAMNVTGVQKLTIEVKNTGSEFGETLLDKGKLYKADAESNNCNYVQLADLVPVDGREYSVNNTNMWRDNTGCWHNGYISMAADQGGFAVWNLNKQYSSADITCAIPNCGGGDTSITVNVYGNNVLLDSKEMLNKTSDSYVFPSDIDLSDIKLLKIEVVNESDEYDTYGYLVDSRLYLK